MRTGFPSIMRQIMQRVDQNERKCFEKRMKKWKTDYGFWGQLARLKFHLISNTFENALADFQHTLQLQVEKLIRKLILCRY